jgi:hypothetical protein
MKIHVLKNQPNISVTFSGGKVKQGCQKVCFQTKNPNLGKFCRASEWKMLVNLLVIWNILQPFGIFCGHLVMLWYVIWYIFPSFGILCPEISGNPEVKQAEDFVRWNSLQD